jgi:hypothetical protein
VSVKVRWKNGEAPALLLSAPEPVLAKREPPEVAQIAPVPPPVPEPLPRLVRLFWEHDPEDFIPSWRRESDSERDRRRFLERQGIWTG